jgi:hypothetical protein
MEFTNSVDPTDPAQQIRTSGRDWIPIGKARGKAFNKKQEWAYESSVTDWTSHEQ